MLTIRWIIKAFSFLSMCFYRLWESRTDTPDKENKDNNKANIWKLSMTKVTETKPS